MFVSKELNIKTKEVFEIIDLTQEVKDFVKENEFKNWHLNVFTKHTTAILKINEAEDGFWLDLKDWCDKNVNIDVFYRHNDLENRDPKTMCESKEECLNGHSHIRAMLIWDSSETIPVINWELQFGVWQRVLFIELDHARDRQLILSFIWE